MKLLSVGVAIILALLLAAKMPQALFIPLAIILWAFRGFFIRLAGRVSAGAGFIGSAWALGMIIEVFAVWQNQPVPVGRRLLFSQDFGQDLVIAAVFYLLCAIIWYFLLRRYSFTAGQALGIQAIWSFVEQRGAVLRFSFALGPAGLFILLFVAGVYGTWIFFPVLFTRNKFQEQFPNRIAPRWRHFILAIFILYAFIFGLVALG